MVRLINFHKPVETICDYMLTIIMHDTVVERSGSGVELRTLDYENPGSNPVLRCLNLGQVFSLYIAELTRLYK